MALTIGLDTLLEDGNLPDPVTYQYYRGLLNNTIIINDEINDCLLEYATIPLMEMDKDPNVKSIDIILNTPGGDIYDGFSFVSVLENVSKPVTLRIIGMAASMGGLIAMAKNPNLKVICDRFAVGLIHSGSQYMEGSAHAVKDTFDFSQHYEEKIKNYILTHTKIDDDLYDKIERKEYWMDADEMKRLGIVDEII